MKATVNYTIEQHAPSNSLKTTYEPLVFCINLSIHDEHNIIGLYGPSGAGKSTILKILAGLVPKASYSLNWRELQNSNEKAQQNPCVYVGEDSQLFAHLSLFDNLELVEKWSESRTQSPFSINEVISLCDLFDLRNKMPSQLSTGEKQRACFARAILSGKKILLLDEAFSALDWPKRELFNRLLRDMVRKHNYLVIMVSHSLRELSLCATQLISVDAGKITEHASISNAVTKKLANIDSEHEHYFSVVSAKFSHVDEQDAALQVWTLLSVNQHGLQSNKQETNCAKNLFVKKRFTLSTCSIAERDKPDEQTQIIQTFVIDANKVSISMSAAHQTSMVNCLSVLVDGIAKLDAGVLVRGKWQSQVVRAIITTKSLAQLNIKFGDTVYFVFKAL